MVMQGGGSGHLSMYHIGILKGCGGDWFIGFENRDYHSMN